MKKLSWQAVTVLLIGAAVGLALTIVGFIGDSSLLMLTGLGILAASLTTGGVKYTFTKPFVLLLTLALTLTACSTSIEYTSRDEQSSIQGDLFASSVELKLLGQELKWVNQRFPRREFSTTRPGK